MPISSNDKTMAILSHVLSLVFGVLAPLIFYVAMPYNPYVREHARRSLNFQLSVLIYGAISVFLVIVLIGFVLIPIVGAFDFIAVILATVKASDDRMFDYPLSIQFIKNTNQ